MAKNPLEARVMARLSQDATFTNDGLSPLERRIAQRMGVTAPVATPTIPTDDTFGTAVQGAAARVGRFFTNVFADPNKDLSFGPSAADIAQMRALGVGILGPAISGVQGLLQIPGLVTSRDLPTDRAAQFVERFKLGLVTDAEEAALTAGISPEGVADAHLAGELVGFMAPVVASLKAARLVTGIRGGSVISLQRNFILDSAAGVIFGATLTPEEELGQRALNTLRESAIFGLGGLMINGLMFAATGMTFARATVLQKNADLLNKLQRVTAGETVVLGEEGITMAKLMSEQSYLASSPEAHALLTEFATDAALIQGVKSTAEAGLSRGYVRQIADDFQSAVAAVDKFKVEFPNLKFDIIKRQGEFDIHFGLTGLNNGQKAQLAREGRYAGQMVQKNGSAYSYVRTAKEPDSIIVRTIDGKVTRIKSAGVTDLPVASEEIPLPSAGQALYADFREFFFGKMRQAGGASGGLDETDIIKFIREGQLGFDDASVRAFESGGAITHPAEIGVGPGTGQATVEEFAAAYLQDGAHGNGLLAPAPIRRFDDAFEAWLRERKLTPNATDIEAFRASFNQRMREDIWKLVPDEDLATMQAIRDETTALIEKDGVPFAALANEKGFHVERLPDGLVSLRDINTGARLTFGSERFARDALPFVVRTEKDAMFEFLTPGNHGVPGFTGGFDPTDGTFTFDVNIAPDEFLPHLPTQSITNTRDYMIAIEDISGVPLFNEGFALIDNAVTKQRLKLEPLGREIASIWKGISRNDRKVVAEFWTSIEGSDLAGTALVRAAKKAGLSGRQINALTRARAMFDLGAQEMGLPESRFISNYYSRIRPAMAENGRVDVARLLSDDPVASQEFKFWAEMQRTGELPQVELDPEIVMHKYFRALTYAQEVRPLEGRVRAMMGTRIRDLPATQQRNILQRSLPGTTVESHVFPKEVRGMLQEYLNNIRGDTNSGFASARRFTTKIFNAVGIKTDPRLFDELHSTFLSSQYGAAIGLRLVLMNRNATQNLWTMYTRVGAKHGSESLGTAMTQRGFDKWLAAGAIRSTDVAVPSGDAIFKAWFTEDIAKGTGPLSNAAASMIRLGVRTGRLSRSVAQKFLVPYGSGDQINRAWAAEWQYLHTAESLAKFDAHKIDWDGFLEEGLPFFSDSIKRGFRARFDKFGREQALLWIGKQAADEAHFIYGAASTPSWMQRPFGRLFGVFGQWPLWAKQLYVNRMAHASPRQIAQFWARSAALTGAFTNVSMQTGVNMWNWIAPLSLGYSGGPSVDMALTAREIWSGPLENKSSSIRRLGQQVGSLSLPGQLFYKEMAGVLNTSDPAQAAFALTLGRQADQSNYAYDFTFNPAADNEPAAPLAAPTSNFNPLQGLRPIAPGR